MSLKTSFCNKSLIKSDFKRLWWIPALHTIMLFLTGTMVMLTSYYQRRLYYNNYIVEEFQNSPLIWDLEAYSIFALIVPVILGVMLFSYMQTGKAATFAHGIPVSRGQQYISHIISGVLMFVIPLLINAVILLVFRIDAGFAKMFRVSHLICLIWEVFLCSLVAFSGACFVSFIAGNTIASLIFTYIFGALPAFAEMFISFFAETQLHGYVYNDNYSVSSFLYVNQGELIEWKNTLLYLFITAVFFILGFVLYKLRNIENHSEVVAFPKLRPIFIYGVGICCGCVGFGYFHGIWNVNNALLLIPLGILGIVVAQMIVKKSFKVPEVYKPVLGYSAFILVIFVIFTFDLTGYERRLPDADDIEYVTFSQENFNINRDLYWAYNGSEYKLKQPFSPDIKDKESIEDVLYFHKCMTTLKETRYDRPQQIYLTYRLKNGKTLRRMYRVNMIIHKDLLEDIIESDVIRQKYFPILREEERTINSVSIVDYRLTDPYYRNIYPNEEEDMTRLITALEMDLRNADYDDYATRNTTSVELEFRIVRPGVHLDGKDVETQSLSEAVETYCVRPSYVNTIALLEEWGFFDALPVAEDIASINIEQYSSEGRYSANKEITDPEEIKAVLDYVGKYPSTEYNNTEIYIHYKDGHSFTCFINGYMDNVPQCLKP